MINMNNYGMESGVDGGEQIPHRGFASDSSIDYQVDKARSILTRTVNRYMVSFPYKGIFSHPGTQSFISRSLKDYDLSDDEILAVQSLRERDVANSGHPFNYENLVATSMFTLLLGRDLGLSREQLLTYGKAAILHDIGKLKTKAEVLYKPGKLTPPEKEEIKSHPVDGVVVLDRLGINNPVIRKTVEWHHVWMYLTQEGIDAGVSYPNYIKPNLTLEQIQKIMKNPLESGIYSKEAEIVVPTLGDRLVAVSDATDSMIVGRYYRSHRDFKEGSIEHAISELERESELSERNKFGIHFDKTLVNMIIPHLRKAS